jgi:hypothetical protein
MNPTTNFSNRIDTQDYNFTIRIELTKHTSCTLVRRLIAKLRCDGHSITEVVVNLGRNEVVGLHADLMRIGYNYKFKTVSLVISCCL